MKHITDAYSLSMAQPLRKCSHIEVTLISDGVQYIFNDDEIYTAKKVSDVDPLSRRLPKETFTFSVFDFAGDYNPANPSGKWNALDENAPLSVRFGYEVNNSIEWLSPDQYILDGKPSVIGEIATFHASSHLLHLTDTYYKGTAEHRSFYDLAVNVLTDAGLLNTEFLIDEHLKGLFTDAPLPVTSHRNCLQMIAHAVGCVLRTDSENRVRIESFVLSAQPLDFIIGLNSIAYGGDKIAKIETLYKARAYKYEYKSESSAAVLFETTVDVEGSIQCHAEYGLSREQAVSISGSGILENVQTYAGAADFTVKGTGTFTITITGKRMRSANSLAESVTSQNADGATDTEKNALITDSSLQSALIFHTANYLQFRMTHTVNYRGNPELDAQDVVYLETAYGSHISALILSHTITYNGALSGTVVLKSLSEASSAYLYDANASIVEDKNNEKIGIVGIGNYTSAYTTTEINSFIKEVNS